MLFGASSIVGSYYQRPRIIERRQKEKQNQSYLHTALGGNYASQPRTAAQLIFTVRMTRNAVGPSTNKHGLDEKEWGTLQQRLLCYTHQVYFYRSRLQ